MDDSLRARMLQSSENASNQVPDLRLVMGKCAIAHDHSQRLVEPGCLEQKIRCFLVLKRKNKKYTHLISPEILNLRNVLMFERLA